MTYFEYLNSFHKISEAEFELLEGHFQTKNFHKGDVIVKENQVQRNIYFVRSGVQMAYFQSSQRLHVISFSYPPQVCSITESFAFQKTTKQAIICLSESELDYISFEQLQSLYSECPNIERLFRKMAETFLAGLVNRNIEFHATSMEERFLAFCNRSAHLLHLVPHKYIASFLDIDPANFSKLFNRLKI